MCLYRLAHGCTFMTGDLFGVAESTAHVIFIEVCKAIVSKMYDKFVYLPRNIEFEGWRKELQNSLENWKFPCVGPWDGFHVFVSTKLNNFYSFKKRYSVTIMDLNVALSFSVISSSGSSNLLGLFSFSLSFSFLKSCSYSFA